MTKYMMRPLAAAAAALTLGLGALPAQALTFDLSFTAGTTAAQQSAFQAAADYWSGKLTDNVTVSLEVGFTALPTGILAQAGSSYVVATYGDVRGAMLTDVSSTVDLAATGHLQSGPTLSFMSTNMDGGSRLNNDTTCAVAGTTACSNDNQYLAITSANARALGIGTPGGSDGTIVFNTVYAATYQFDRSGGIGPGMTDFITVAQHEIAHALGFTSGVDSADYCLSNPTGCGFSASPSAFALEQYAVYSTLDLFRYSAPGVLDMRVGGLPYFSIDGGATAVMDFSTGEYNGDGWQASHFGTGVVTLMRPWIDVEEAYDAFPEDLTAMDAIGWDLAVAVPEPGTYALMLGGLALVAALARRRRAA